VYIERVVIRDIKGFEDAELNFCPDGENHAGWAVITGDNGAGKTAFLRSIALALLGPRQYFGALPDLRGWVMHGKKSGSISVEIRPDRTYDTTERGGQPHKSTFWAEIEIRDEQTPTLSATDIFRKRKKGATNGPWSEATGGWFSLGYGPYRRLYGSSPVASRMMALPGRPPRFGTLFMEDATLGEGEEWITNLYVRSIDERSGADTEAESDTLSALLQMLRDDFLRRGIAVEDVSSAGLGLRDSAGRLMTLAEMSEGYRSAVAMLVDIFRHMVSVYGRDIVTTDEEGHSRVDRPGVVLIDEADAHLHPEWQREVGFWLVRHFPKVQFVVTTHSPLVCAAATHGRIYHLPPVGTGKPFQLTETDFEQVIAGKPDEILLTPAFGLSQTRSPRAVNARQKHALLISKQLAVGQLTTSELAELEQLKLFVDPEETGLVTDAADSPAVAASRN
jgi:hypothetical protein